MRCEKQEKILEISNFVYSPAIRVSAYNTGAIKELDDEVKSVIIPRFIMRGKSDNLKFLSDWGETPSLLEVSTFQMDVNEDIPQRLNDPTDYFANQLAFFESAKEISPQVIPVINPPKNTKIRDLFQLFLKLDFDTFAYRVDVTSDRSRKLFNLFLNVVSDEDCKKLILIIDNGKIDDFDDVKYETINNLLNTANNYEFLTTILSSTSYPSARPPSGSTASHECIDPLWQYMLINSHKQSIIYGDYSATDPTSERFEFEFAVRPIPFATYMLDDSFDWWLIREGKGAENEKFREIAGKIQAHPQYHGDDFCFANRIIKQTATGEKVKPGNQAYWNKLKINQHISAIINAYNQGLFISITEEEDTDYDF